MAGKLVKTKSGKVGRTKDNDPPVFMDIKDEHVPHFQVTRRVEKLKVYFDDGTKMLCNAKDLQPLGYWD